MKRLTVPAALTLAVMAMPMSGLPVTADDAHHPGQTAPSTETQAPVQAAPAPAAPPAQIQVPTAPSRTPAPTTGQGPAGPGRDQTLPGQTQGGMMNCPMQGGQAAEGGTRCPMPQGQPGGSGMMMPGMGHDMHGRSDGMGQMPMRSPSAPPGQSGSDQSR